MIGGRRCGDQLLAIVIYSIYWPKIGLGFYFSLAHTKFSWKFGLRVLNFNTMASMF